MVSRALISVLLLFCGGRGSADSARVTVVYTSEAQPYVDALDGLRTSLSAGAQAVDMHAPNAQTQLNTSLDAGTSRMIVTIGRDALEAVAAHKNEAPVVATMIMQSELAGKQRPHAAVRLDISLATVLSELKVVFPQKNRVVVLRNPALAGQLDPAALARGRQQGFVVQVVDAANPEDSLRALRSLKGRADFVICLPDSALYNSATVKPLILAALESHLPIVGFSQNFVRAGAAVGVYPDFHDIGVQTGEMVQKLLSPSAAGSVEGPRKVVVGVNQRVMRLLGLEYREAGNVVTVR